MFFSSFFFLFLMLKHFNVQKMSLQDILENAFCISSSFSFLSFVPFLSLQVNFFPLGIHTLKDQHTILVRNT